MFSIGRENLIVIAISGAGLIAAFTSPFLLFLGYAALPLVTLIPGFVLIRIFAPSDRLTRVAMAFPLSLMVSSLYALILAVVGVFNQITLSTGLFLVSCLFMLISRRTGVRSQLPAPQLHRWSTIVLAIAIAIAVASNVGILILFQYPVGYDVWSFMASSKLISSTGSIPMWLDGSVGQVNFYPPLFPLFMGSLLVLTGAQVVSVFWIAPLFLVAFFILSVFGFARLATMRMGGALISALFAATIGSAKFEGMDRVFPVSLAMIAFPAFLLIWICLQENTNAPRLAVAGLYSAFLWLCFPPAGLLAVVVTLFDVLFRGTYRSRFLVWAKVSIIGAVPVGAFYIPFLGLYGLPRNNFFAPWLSSFQSATIFSASFLQALFNYSGFLIPAGLVLSAYVILHGKKAQSLNWTVLAWSLVTLVAIPVWELVFQNRLQFLGSIRFVPFFCIGYALLSGSLLAPFLAQGSNDSRSLLTGRQLIALVFTTLIVFSSVAVTANANITEWSPPAAFPVSSSYFRVVTWLHNNSQAGSVVLTLDPLAQPLMVDIVGKGVHTTYDVTTYAFWVSPEVETGYSDTVAMLIGNNASSLSLISKYNVSYILITSSTVQYLSQIEGISQSQVERILTAEFVNNTRFSWAFSDLSSYQSQAITLWSNLQKSSTGGQLQNLWNQLPAWANSAFRMWLQKSGYNFYQLTWDQVLQAVRLLDVPNLASLAPSLSLTVMPLPVIYKVLSD